MKGQPNPFTIRPGEVSARSAIKVDVDNRRRGGADVPEDELDVPAVLPAATSRLNCA